jgi:hypothetical protein
VDEFAYVAIQFAAQVPVLIVLVVGLVLVAARRRSLNGRAAALAVAGCAVLLLATVANVAWIASIPWLLDGRDVDARDFAVLASGVGLALTLVHATGLALIIGAVLAGRRPPAPPTFPMPRDTPSPAPHIRAL